MGGDLVTFWLIGGAPLQPGCNGKPCGPEIFKANQIGWFFYTKFQHHDQRQNQHHDWNLLNKFWSLITVGVLITLRDYNRLKRLKLFQYFKNKISSKGILGLQETHSSKVKEKIWSDEFNDDLLFSHGKILAVF